MGTITSGIGLVSGINTSDVIAKLMAIEAQPQTLLKSRIQVLQTKQTSLQAINAKVLGLKSAVNALTKSSLYSNTATTSSDSSVISGTSTSSAAVGSYAFSISRLVTTQQSISAGFSDLNSSAVGAGSLTFRPAEAQLSTDNSLSQLNGGQGVARGKIRIIDRSGNSAIVDLSKAVSVNDVLDAINDASGISVAASVSGDSFKLTDSSGGSGSLQVQNVGASTTAAALGLTTDIDGSATTLTGAVVNTVSRASKLSSLNDGTGVAVGASGTDLTFDDGTTNFNVNLASAQTLGDAIDAINTAATTAGITLTAAVNDSGNGLKITHAGTLSISGTSAGDLGLTASNVAGNVTGTRVIASLNSRLLGNLNAGVGVTLGTLDITNRSGSSFSVNLAGASSVSDILDAINTAGAAYGITAGLSQSSTGIAIADSTGGNSANLQVSSADATAASLGISQSTAESTIQGTGLNLQFIAASTRLDLLHGGAGINRGKFTITDSNGVSTTVDLSQGNEITIDDVISEINSRGIGVTASVNSTGDGLLLHDTAGGASKLTVAELGSTTAADLGILGSAETAGGDLNGSFAKTLTIDSGDTLQDVIDSINAADIGVNASVINDGSSTTPYRLSLTAERSGRAGAFTVDDGGLGFGVTAISQGQDAVAFYGSTDPAKAVAIVSPTNTLTNVISGVTVDLNNVSSNPVTLSVSRDDSGISTAVQSVVTAFNSVIDTLKQYDSYDSTTQTKSLLLGDPTLATVRSSMYRAVNGIFNELTTQYKSLTQLGVSVVDGAKLSFDSGKFGAALQKDRNAVVQFFTYKTTTTNSKGETVLATGGFGTRFDDILDNLTDSVTGTFELRDNALQNQIDLGNKRVDDMQTLLDAKKVQLQTQFNAMEIALSKLQSQSSALSSLSSLVTGISATKSSS